MCIMQIPYDLEFVENRPRVEVQARAIAIQDPYAWNGTKARSREDADAFDLLLRWVHRQIGKLEKH